eukprot:gene1602-979_t
MSEGLSAAAQVPLPPSGNATPLPPPKYSAALFELPASIRASLPEDRVEATELSLGLLKTTAEALDLTEERVKKEREKIFLANLGARLAPPKAPPRKEAFLQEWTSTELRSKEVTQTYTWAKDISHSFQSWESICAAYTGSEKWVSLRKRAIEAAPDLNMALLQSGEPSNAELVGGAPRNFFSLESRFEVAPSLLGGEYMAPLRDASGNQIGALDLSELEEFLARFNNNTDQGLVQIRDFVRKLVQKGNSQPMGSRYARQSPQGYQGRGRNTSYAPPKRQAPPGKLSAPTGHHPVGDSKGLLSGGDFLHGRTSDVELDGILLRYLPKNRVFRCRCLIDLTPPSAEADLHEHAMDTKARRYSVPPGSLVGGSAIIDDPVYVRCEPIARRNGYSFLLAATFLANQADGSRRSYTAGALRECMRRNRYRQQHRNPDVSIALADYGFTIFRYLADADGHPHLERSTPLPPGGVFFLESDGSVPLPISIEGHEFVLGAQRELATDDEEHPPASAAYELTTDPSAACIGLYRPQLNHPSSVVARDSFPLLPPSPHRDYTEREGKG